MKQPKKPSMAVKLVERRKRVIARHEAQLKSGVKNTKEGSVPLSDGDIKRINKELTILKARV